MVSTKLKYTGLPTVNSFFKRITESQIFDQVPIVQSVTANGPLLRHTVANKHEFLTISPIGRGAGIYRSKFDFSYTNGNGTPSSSSPDRDAYFGIAFVNRPAGTSSSAGVVIAGIMGIIESTTGVTLSKFSYSNGTLTIGGSDGRSLAVSALTEGDAKHSLDLFLDVNVNDKISGNDVVYTYGCDSYLKLNGLKVAHAQTIMDDAIVPNLTGYCFVGGMSDTVPINTYNLRGVEYSYSQSTSEIFGLLEDL
uniref:Uncharacterized protein n=1 Tax=viral metagenome TaxID=1070528 RepID=A0A2V0RGX2_9ZZZZ